VATLGLNVLISGATQAGKTTLLNSLANLTPPNLRLITIEEVFELHPTIPDVIQMQTKAPNLQGAGEVNLRRLIKESLRMRPNRLIIGEVREAEALDLLIALNSGIPAMGTIHANSARDAILKLQTLPLLAGENISSQFIGPMISKSLHLVIHCKMESNGFRRVSEIAYISGRYEQGNIELEPIFTYSQDQYQVGLGLNSASQRFGL
jgi:pilus assembly protein CpaF